MINGIQSRYPKALIWGILISFIALNSIMLALEIYYIPLVPAALLSNISVSILVLILVLVVAVAGQTPGRGRGQRGGHGGG